MPCDATRTTILSWGSSLLQGVTRSTHRAPLDARHLSWGSFPFSACGGWSLRDFCQTVPSARLRSIHRVSHPLDGLLLHPPSTPFGVVTLVGFSLQGLPLPNRPMSSSLTGPLMALIPQTAHSPPRKERTKGAKDGFPRMVCRTSPLPPTGCCSVRESVPCGNTVKFSRRPIPSWVSSSRGLSHHQSRGVFTLAAHVLRCLTLKPAPLRVPTCPYRNCTPAYLALSAVPFSLETGFPSEVSRLQILTRMRQRSSGLSPCGFGLGLQVASPLLETLFEPS